MVTDEAVDTENENVFQDETPRQLPARAMSRESERSGSTRPQVRRFGAIGRWLDRKPENLQTLCRRCSRRTSRSSFGVQARRRCGMTRRTAVSTRVSSTSSRTPLTSVKAPGKRRRHGADQIVDGARARAPIDAAVLRAAPAEVRPSREIQRARRRAAGNQFRQAPREHLLRGIGDLHRHLERRVVLQNRRRTADPPARPRRASPACSADSRP